ncbi:hypothetical protein ACODT5_03770 [Streptomyces sp. 5.8]|uniref:hypothetical protein n=1 Tax=Streptomyces sp. 5.8 TaxID=3406571 RepID=UPI003BB620FA
MTVLQQYLSRLAAVGLIKGLYPILWGRGQIPTGHLADRIGHEILIVHGSSSMRSGSSSVSRCWTVRCSRASCPRSSSAWGTAMVYPALIASISDHAHPGWRANALGTYRFWRDIGSAAGALVASILGLNATVIAAAVITATPGLLAAPWITEHKPQIFSWGESSRSVTPMFDCEETGSRETAYALVVRDTN